MTTTSSISDFADALAPPARKAPACVQAAYTFVAPFFSKRLGRFHQRSRGVDDVVDHQRRASGNIADQVHHFADVHVDAALVDDRQRRIDSLGEKPRALHAARIGRNHRNRSELLLLEIFDQHRRRVQVVHRNVEISLNLRRVQIERKHAARARRFQQDRPPASPKSARAAGPCGPAAHTGNTESPA